MLTTLAVLTALTPTTLVAVHLWSSDPGRRERALAVLKLLLRRR